MNAIKILVGITLFPLLLTQQSLARTKTRPCPNQGQKPVILLKKPPVGAVGVSRVRAFFVIEKKLVWCAIKTKAGKTHYEYRGLVDFENISSATIQDKREKLVFSKKREYKAIKVYFENSLRKRTILKINQCFSTKPRCSSQDQVKKFYDKIFKLIPKKKKKSNCKRRMTSNCPGDPNPYGAKNRKIYCEKKLYQPAQLREYDYFIKAKKPDDISLSDKQMSAYKFRDNSDPKAKVGSGYYLTQAGRLRNKVRPKKLWGWEKLLTTKTCSINEVKDIEKDIAKEFASKSFMVSYNKEAYIETNQGAPKTKSNEKIAVFVLGAAASGKTTTTKRGISRAVNNHFCKTKRPCNIVFKIVDGGIMRDVSQVWLDLKEIANDRGYAGFKDQYNLFSPFFKKLKAKLIDEAIKNGTNIIIPETAANEVLKLQGGPVTKLMDRLHRKGYKILMTSIYVSKAQAKKFGTARSFREGKSYSSLGWGFSQEQTEKLFNYARSKKYSPELPMYIFDNSVKFWKIKDPKKWFDTKGVKTVIPKGCQVKRKCSILGTCKFNAIC